MTNEQAINELKEDKAMYMPKEWIEDIDRDTPDGKLITALDMAIKALEQQTSDCKIFGHKENCILGADCENCDYKIQALEQPTSDDCVSRAELIKIYENRFIELQKAHQTDKQLGVNWCINTLKDMPPVTPTQNWVPVSERLPNIKNRTEKYLVTLKDKTVSDAMFTECDRKHWWSYDYDGVIAWMPLPEPYEEKRGNEK